jgi:hypothetical protein
MPRIVYPQRPFTMPPVWAPREALSMSIAAPDGFLAQIRPVDPEFYDKPGNIDVREYLKLHDEYFQDRLSNGKIIYHYTTLSALHGIVSDGALWASDVRQLNDRWEIRYALNQLGSILAGDETLKDRRQPIDAIFGVDRFWQFATCFSKSRDQLSQWRAYGAQLGVAIAFDRDHLEFAAEKAGGSILDCRYINYEQFSSLESELLPIKEGLRTDGAFNEKGELINTKLQIELTKRAIDIASSIKHPSFMEEQEVRFIVAHAELNNPLLFRSSEKSLVPYVGVEVDVRKIGDGKRRKFANYLGMMEVIVWPHNADNQILDALELLLKGVGQVPIVRSESPYRT